MAKYLTAKQLGILPEERKALIAFIKSPSLGRTIMVNGKAHYYDQSYSSKPEQAEKNDCGTAGCVAGYVFVHAKVVQRKKNLRSYFSAWSYLEGAAYNSPFFTLLYEQGAPYKLAITKKVVEKGLQTGKISWPARNSKTIYDF